MSSSVSHLLVLLEPPCTNGDFSPLVCEDWLNRLRAERSRKNTSNPLKSYRKKPCWWVITMVQLGRSVHRMLNFFLLKMNVWLDGWVPSYPRRGGRISWWSLVSSAKLLPINFYHPFSHLLPKSIILARGRRKRPLLPKTNQSLGRAAGGLWGWLGWGPAICHRSEFKGLLCAGSVARTIQSFISSFWCTRVAINGQSFAHVCKWGGWLLWGEWTGRWRRCCGWWASKADDVGEGKIVISLFIRPYIHPPGWRSGDTTLCML